MELPQRFCEVASHRSFFRQIPLFDVLICGCPVKGYGFLGAVEDGVIEFPQLGQRVRLSGRISDPDLDRERFPVGIFRRFGPSRSLMHHADLMPGRGDRARFVQAYEPIAGIFVSLRRLRVAALVLSDGSKLPFSNGDPAFVTAFLIEVDALFVSGCCLVEPAQLEKTISSFKQADGCHSLRPPIGPVPLERLRNASVPRPEAARTVLICRRSSKPVPSGEQAIARS